MRVAAIFLLCAACLVSAQYSDSDGPQRGISPVPIRATRFQRLPVSRPSAPSQNIYSNQRLRRPNVTFRSRGGSVGEDSVGLSSPFSSTRPVRPNAPSGPAAPVSYQVKPVNEEVEEEERLREPTRDDRRNDEVQETAEVEDESEENIARAVANLGAVGSSGQSSRGSFAPTSIQTQPQPVQYRPSQSVVPTGRGGSGSSSPPPPAPVQYRPAPKPAKPRKQFSEEPQRQTVKATIVKPTKQVHAYDARGKKPVAQIIRRYRNDNPDGSITWGFENDDGSYKEEIIGIDCITRGKYGYIDPDGLRREYTYETGIKCDEQQREEYEENGFVDYQENKLVLPDGKTIDLSNMGKKQARRPRPSY